MPEATNLSTLYWGFEIVYELSHFFAADTDDSITGVKYEMRRIEDANQYPVEAGMGSIDNLQVIVIISTLWVGNYCTWWQISNSVSAPSNHSQEPVLTKTEQFCYYFINFNVDIWLTFIPHSYQFSAATHYFRAITRLILLVVVGRCWVYCGNS